MNFFSYLGISKDEFIEKYLHGGLVTESIHKEFPLNIFTYSRKCVHDNIWDSVTSKCRGIIVNRHTDEIVARPFEKFHNYGSTVGSLIAEGATNAPEGEPTIIEKVDGFMCTMYTWQGRNYIASKGSFHSIHAKWATAELDKMIVKAGLTLQGGSFKTGYTAVFEGLCRDLRIVVDYGDRSGLVLLALINNETGEEIPLDSTEMWGLTSTTGFKTSKVFNELDFMSAVRQTQATGYENAEGYVLTWYRTGTTPYRLKLKYVEYLRLHRMVTGVSPKRIWEVLSQAHLKADLKEYLEESTPWFSEFVTKWVNAFQREYDRLHGEAHTRYQVASVLLKPVTDRFVRGEISMGELRKAWALEFNKPENKEFSSILFAMLDAKDISVVIWRKCKELARNGHPMVDIHTT